MRATEAIFSHWGREQEPEPTLYCLETRMHITHPCIYRPVKSIAFEV